MFRRVNMFVLLLVMTMVATAQAKMKALIIEGQNNHGVWSKTTQMMKGYLEETGLFSVDVVTTLKSGTDPNFAPIFSDYDVVVSNYNGSPWPEGTKNAFIDYIKGGGG
ncbi:MAG: ThuA domain-containing protein, partial [Planctomycetota bacterium]|nr:ThuA domain-containing protein [Planctomycetota bacterium]